ncbi:hypothetical protein HPP92_001467 [Vanilla planifolia]|uniref:Uncharacterized protein n=1 Tax=Vanilla planifolia TaxID=51239 RepID=A0A835RZC0_VANPL|nr:hypothetical protein HPP92_001467 [Vanilla planifolia]
MIQNARIQLKESLPGTAVFGCNSNNSIMPSGICSVLQLKLDLRNISNRSLFSDYGRRMYYNYRSGGGIPTYTAVTVTSSSIGNSNQQVFICPIIRKLCKWQNL